MTSWFSSEGRSEFFPKRVPEDSKQVAAPTKTKVSQDRGGGIPTEHGCFMMCGPCCILYYLDIIIICETETETLHSSFRENLANISSLDGGQRRRLSSPLQAPKEEIRPPFPEREREIEGEK